MISFIEDNKKIFSPDKIFLYKLDVLGSSNGKNPHTNANKIMPIDQISAKGPKYSFPAIISGAA